MYTLLTQVQALSLPLFFSQCLESFDVWITIDFAVKAFCVWIALMSVITIDFYAIAFFLLPMFGEL